LVQVELAALTTAIMASLQVLLDLVHWVVVAAVMELVQVLAPEMLLEAVVVVALALRLMEALPTQDLALLAVMVDQVLLYLEQEAEAVWVLPVELHLAAVEV
jgi:hypothetical protein